VPGALLARLDVVAPAALTLPGGGRRRIDYAGDAPVIELRVQEAFGWDANPCIADGRIPVALRLLSPAGRPVQTTSDLAGFWRGSYRQVRAELRGRYPKHTWPDEPWLAPAVSSRGTARRGPSAGR
jgi:ATP-dependent helicase HrpB